MANYINLDAESQANYVGDDSNPSLTIANSSTGRAVDAVGAAAAAVRVSVTSGAANATVINPIELVGSSIASGAVLAVLNKSSFVSTATIDVTLADQVGGAIRVVRPDGSLGWIPVYTDSQVTAVAV